MGEVAFDGRREDRAGGSWWTGTAAAGASAGASAGAVSRQLANRLEVFLRFRSPPGRAGDSLAWRVRQALASPPWQRLWALEAVGSARVEEALAAGEPLAGLFADVPALPERAGLPLHTGAGLALGRHVLEGRERRGSAGAPAAAERMRRLAADVAAPSYEGAVFEGLGFVARTLAPGTVEAIDRSLAGRGRDLFWHGVGRGLHLAPGTPWPAGPDLAFACARAEAPDAAARLSALSGAAWALTLVNLRHPATVRLSLAAGLAGAGDDEAAAVAEGVAAACWVARQVAGEAPRPGALWPRDAAVPRRLVAWRPPAAPEDLFAPRFAPRLAERRPGGRR